MVSESEYTLPDAVVPSPYEFLNVVPVSFDEWDCEGEYASGFTRVSELPVS